MRLRRRVFGMSTPYARIIIENPCNVANPMNPITVKGAGRTLASRDAILANLS